MSTPTRRNRADAIRFLSIDAVQQANSGHPGMPMGMAASLVKIHPRLTVQQLMQLAMWLKTSWQLAWQIAVRSRFRTLSA